jgi:hypothetical protein
MGIFHFLVLTGTCFPLLYTPLIYPAKREDLSETTLLKKRRGGSPHRFTLLSNSSTAKEIIIRLCPSGAANKRERRLP